VKAVSAQAIVKAGVVPEADLTPPGGYQWLVYQIGISNNGVNNCTAAVFLNQRFMCGSSVGQQDAADGSPIPVRTGDTIRIVWSGASVASICNVQLLVEEYVMGQPLPTQ
jgi:hypothetical protein